MLASVKTTPTSLGRKAESRDELFVSTRWTLVLKAGDSATTSAHALSALSELCQIYWRPLYVFLRKKGYGREDAQDLTQGFFAHLIETRGYARADPSKGRFRAFLLAALKNFIADARDRQHALKRGGGMILESLDDETETQIAQLPNGRPTRFMIENGRRLLCAKRWVVSHKSARWQAKPNFLVTSCRISQRRKNRKSHTKRWRGDHIVPSLLRATS